MKVFFFIIKNLNYMIMILSKHMLDLRTNI